MEHQTLQGYLDRKPKAKVFSKLTHGLGGSVPRTREGWEIRWTVGGIGKRQVGVKEARAGNPHGRISVRSTLEIRRTLIRWRDSVHDCT
jgi:hypothetical protein